VAGCCEYGDEPSGSGATELVCIVSVRAVLVVASVCPCLVAMATPTGLLCKWLSVNEALGYRKIINCRNNKFRKIKFDVNGKTGREKCNNLVVNNIQRHRL
jgi:hypothetical protein